MKLRPYYYLLGAIVLAAIVFTLERPDRSRNASAEPTAFAPGWSREQIARVEIDHFLNSVVLTRDGESWRVGAGQSALEAERNVKPDRQQQPSDDAPVKSFRADQTLVESMFTAIEKMDVGSAVSHHPDQHHQFQVGKLGLQVRALNAAGEKVLHFYVGKQGQDYFSTYVRRDGEDDVYLVREQLLGRFPAALDVWRDKVVWSVNPDAIHAVEVERRDGGFVLERNAEQLFVVKEPKSIPSLDAEKLRGWFEQWMTLSAVRFIEGQTPKDLGLETPRYKLSVTEADRTVRTLWIGAPADGGSYYAKLDGGEDLLLLPTAFQGAFTVDPETWSSNTQ